MSSPATLPETLTPSIGRATPRVTGPLKVSGQARFAAEFSADFGDELLHAVLVPTTVPRGKIRGIDRSAAEAAAGVVRVFTHENAPRLPYKEPYIRTPVQPKVGDPLRPLATDEVFFSGQPVAVVVAESLEQAEHAATLLRVEIDELPAETDLRAVLKRVEGPTKQDTPRGYAPKKPAESGLLGQPAETSFGNADGALGEAAYRVDLEVEIHAITNNPLEPHATIAQWTGDHLTVWDKNQWVDSARMQLALAFGIDHIVTVALGMRESQVRVISPFIGGGFGSALRTWPHTILTAMCARELARPVRLVLSRKQMFTDVGHRPRTVQRLRMGCDPGGRLRSVIHEGWQETSLYEEYTMNFLSATGMAYATPNLRTAYRLVPLSVPSPNSMRAPGEASGVHGLELAIDALAYEAGVDPLAIRRLNDCTHDPSKGQPFSSKHLAEAYDLGAERIGWAGRSPAPRSMRDGRDFIGLGVSSCFYPALAGPAAALARLLPDGRAEVTTASSDMGPGTYVSMTQVAADTLYLPIERVNFRLGDSAMPLAPVHGGSITMASVGPAVKSACEAALAAAIKVAVADRQSPLHGVSKKKVRFERGELIGPGGRESLADVLARHGEPVEAKATASPNFLKQRKYSLHSFGCVFARVRVDGLTGAIRVERVVAVSDVGRVINPQTAKSQVIGGVVMGLGMALMEEAVMHPGLHRYVNDDLGEYHVPTNRDTPDIEAHFVGEPDYVLNRLGARGVGELATVGTSSAIVNALYHATGVRAMRLPATLDLYLGALA